jgi:hypothetical protein
MGDRYNLIFCVPPARCARWPKNAASAVSPVVYLNSEIARAV